MPNDSLYLITEAAWGHWSLLSRERYNLNRPVLQKNHFSGWRMDWNEKKPKAGKPTNQLTIVIIQTDDEALCQGGVSA